MGQLVLSNALSKKITVGIIGILVVIAFLVYIVSSSWSSSFPSNVHTNSSLTPTLTPTLTLTPNPTPVTYVGTSLLVSGTVIANEGVPTKITFEQMSSTGSLTGQIYSSAVILGNYSVFLPKGEFFAVSVNWEKPDRSTGIHYFIQPYGTNGRAGVNSITCPFEWETYV